MCLVLLRRLLSSNWDELWHDLGDQQKSFTDQVYRNHCCELVHTFTSSPLVVKLINTVMAEADARLRRKLLSVIAEVARNTVGE